MSVFSQPLVCFDVETDGANYSRGHVIEIAAIRIEDGVVVDEFSTLLNPGVSLPPFITQLTGISTHDLAGAPEFDDVAERLLEIMEGAIFVAHNVRFDYSFIKEEFRRVGISFSPKMLCSVKLSRALHPGIKGHKLSDLIYRHDLTYSARHRAYDDAHVVWQFLQYAESTFSPELLINTINRQLKMPSLPQAISRDVIDTLPHAPGVYIFEDDNHMPIYIGKSIDIKKRVLSHFTRDTSEYKEFKMSQNVKHISHQETGGELSALLLESQLIKDLKPLYNRRLRRRREFVVARRVKNTDGYYELLFSALSDIVSDQYGEVMGVYETRTKAKASVLAAVRAFELCPKLCGIEKAHGSCFSYQLGRCKGACISKEPVDMYNRRLQLAFERTSIEKWPYESAIALSEHARQSEGLVVNQWRITGRFSRDSQGMKIRDYEAIFDVDAYKILRAFIKNPSSDLIIQPLAP